MQRSKWTWLAFTVCVGLLMAAMGGLSRSALQLELAEQQAARQSENERLSLWRLETAVLPLIAQENSRPVAMYRAFYLPEHVYSKLYSRIEVGRVQVPSPLLSFESPYIQLHFEFGKDGELGSPQVPTGNMRDLAETTYVAHDRVVDRSRLLEKLREAVTLEQVQAVFTDETRAADEPNSPTPGDGLQAVSQPPAIQQFDELPNQAAVAVFGPQQSRQVEQQQSRSVVEFQRRNSLTTWHGQSGLPTLQPVDQSNMRAVWIANNLLLVRRITLNDESIFQGCLMNWEAISTWLSGEIRDLLPAAVLQPVVTGTMSARPLTLASLPVKLEPGKVVQELTSGTTPLRFSIFVAWAGLILAAVAVAVMLWTAFRLSERRGAFVSAVTHELRTPLTTFQLYTEMLADGRLTDEGKRKRYLDTLRAEADRLSHLVENVLSFARLERTHAAGHVEDIEITDVFARVEQSLRLRAEQAEMTLEVVVPEHEITIQADRGAVERIVFNLVDNACKYGASPDQSQVQLSCQSYGKSAEIRVRDFGMGVSSRDRKRLFRPFSKSANEAAHSAPGVGLGLALCRRLARSMRGNLELDRSTTHGACFVLTLPTSNS